MSNWKHYDSFHTLDEYYFKMMALSHASKVMHIIWHHCDLTAGCVTYKSIPLTASHGFCVFCLFFIQYSLISGEDILKRRKKSATKFWGPIKFSLHKNFLFFSLQSCISCTPCPIAILHVSSTHRESKIWCTDKAHSVHFFKKTFGASSKSLFTKKLGISSSPTRCLSPLHSLHSLTPTHTSLAMALAPS